MPAGLSRCPACASACRSAARAVRFLGRPDKRKPRPWRSRGFGTCRGFDEEVEAGLLDSDPVRQERFRATRANRRARLWQAEPSAQWSRMNARMAGQVGRFPLLVTAAPRSDPSVRPMAVGQSSSVEGRSAFARIALPAGGPLQTHDAGPPALPSHGASCPCEGLSQAETGFRQLPLKLTACYTPAASQGWFAGVTAACPRQGKSRQAER